MTDKDKYKLPKLDFIPEHIRLSAEFIDIFENCRITQLDYYTQKNKLLKECKNNITRFKNNL